MGNSKVAAMFRSSDEAAAVRIAGELLDLAIVAPYASLDVQADLMTPEEVLRWEATYPGGCGFHCPASAYPDGDVMIPRSALQGPETALTAYLPAWLWIIDAPLDLAPRALSARGTAPALLSWDIEWPAERAWGLDFEGKYGQIDLALNCHFWDGDELARTDDFTVYIHDYGSQVMRRAERLAYQIGHEVLGGPYHGT
ncbi:hypothetical protein [Yinghuangia soli]|uniref:Uncharacterized protein n=1 Tax=Yinghuangia soli TaxID=2908204 RepID=A0AA41PU94_9ACTN|nr:hypothetical protein [Yinghuangia soli]MCF2525697.1 hypothetical protein [Yinghuangia soli]